MLTSWEGLRPPSPLTEKRDGEDSQGTIEPPKEAAVLKKVQKKGGGLQNLIFAETLWHRMPKKTK
ncbi:MAG: hypothetical protein OXE55_00405 [Flavobacteriaceae bacterium]|nr:hypothetical protein [Flavobacteriaceae bacterium]